MKRERPYVTITVRQAEYWPDRNSDMADWKKAAAYIGQFYDVVWVHDTATALEAASWDIDMRLALYEGAVCNLGVGSGPMALTLVSKSRHIIFMNTESVSPASSLEFLRRHGVYEGDQWSANGRTVWKPALAETIIEEFNESILQGA